MSRPISMDKEKVQFNLARLKKGGMNWEIVIDPNLAIDFKNNVENISIIDVLKSENIFVDAKKGMLAPTNSFSNLFNTEDKLKIAEIIIKEGELHLTPEHRKAIVDQKRRRIVDIIHKNSVDPKTHIPHPVTRIENAMEVAKIKIDECKSAENQVKEIISKLRPIIPIRFEVKEIEVKIDATHAPKTQRIISKYGKILRDDWLNDGSRLLIMEIPGGLSNDFIDELNAFTKGGCDIKIIKTHN